MQNGVVFASSYIETCQHRLGVGVVSGSLVVNVEEFVHRCAGCPEPEDRLKVQGACLIELLFQVTGDVSVLLFVDFDI